MAINDAFRIAGFPYGRPALPLPADYVPSFAGSLEVLVSLFSDDVVNTFNAVGDGGDYHNAASILEFLLHAGYATDGRRLDATGVSIGDVTVSFAPESDHRADMSRRIRALRSQAIRLDGGIDSATGGSSGGATQTVLDAIRAAVAAHSGLPNVHHIPPQLTPGTILPSYGQSATEALFSRRGLLFWESVKEVPDTPGVGSAVGHGLVVTGQNDTDYAWRELVDIAARASLDALTIRVTNNASAIRGLAAGGRTLLETGGGLAYNNDGELHTVPSLVAIGLASDAATAAIAAESLARTMGDDTLDEKIETNKTAISRLATGGIVLAQGGGLALNGQNELQTDPLLVTLETKIASIDRSVRDASVIRRAADNALDARLDILEAGGIPDPVVEPGYWVDTTDARTITIYFHPDALPTNFAFPKVDLIIAGLTATQVPTSTKQKYEFPISKTWATNISDNRNTSQTLEIQVKTRTGDVVKNGWTYALPVVETAPNLGSPVVILANKAAYTALTTKDAGTWYGWTA